MNTWCSGEVAVTRTASGLFGAQWPDMSDVSLPPPHTGLMNMHVGDWTNSKAKPVAATALDEHDMAAIVRFSRCMHVQQGAGVTLCHHEIH